MKIRLVFILMILLLGGCYEDASVTLHQPHEYSGKPDPHAEDATTRANKLAARFRSVQTDR